MTSNNNTPHVYNGSLAVCMTCFKIPTDPVHIAHVIPANAPATNAQDKTPIQIRESREGKLWFDTPAILPHVFTGKGPICTVCLKTKHESKHIEPTFTDPAKLIVVENLAKKLVIPNACNGHECPKCSTIWHHEDSCQNSNQTGLCKSCAQNAAAFVNRKHNIEQIAVSANSTMEPREVKEIMLKHEEFVVLNLVRNPDGSLRADWQERIDAHRADLRNQIEKLNIWQQAASIVQTRTQEEELTKLTDAEREQYERDARRNRSSATRAPKKAKEAKPPATPKPKPTPEHNKQVHKQMLDMLLTQIKAKKPGISDAAANEIANKHIAKVNAAMANEANEANEATDNNAAGNNGGQA